MQALIDVSQRETECEIDYEALQVRFQHGSYLLKEEGLVPCSKDQQKSPIKSLGKRVQRLEEVSSSQPQ